MTLRKKILTKCFILLGFCILLINCAGKQKNNNISKKDDDSVIHFQVDDKKYIDSLQDQALRLGNEQAFNLLVALYSEAKRDKEFLYSSIYMGNKFKYSLAYFNAYIILLDKNYSEKPDVDSTTKCLALFYLLKSYEMGSKDAVSSVIEEFGKKPPNSNFYLKKLMD
jgi:hypothetical protein